MTILDEIEQEKLRQIDLYFEFQDTRFAVALTLVTREVVRREKEGTPFRETMVKVGALVVAVLELYDITFGEGK